jgi:hypothetical protein
MLLSFIPGSDAAVLGGKLHSGTASAEDVLWAGVGFIPGAKSAKVLAKLQMKFLKGVGRYFKRLHHIATNKNRISAARGGPWTPIFEAMFHKAGMNLKDADNVVSLLGHYGPHSAEYYDIVYKRLYQATEGLSGKAYERALRQELRALKKEIQAPGSHLNRLLTGFEP